jgi:hypothetical protein
MATSAIPAYFRMRPTRRLLIGMVQGWRQALQRSGAGGGGITKAGAARSALTAAPAPHAGHPGMPPVRPAGRVNRGLHVSRVVCPRACRCSSVIGSMAGRGDRCRAGGGAASPCGARLPLSASPVAAQSSASFCCVKFTQRNGHLHYCTVARATLLPNPAVGAHSCRRHISWPIFSASLVCLPARALLNLHWTQMCPPSLLPQLPPRAGRRA